MVGQDAPNLPADANDPPYPPGANPSHPTPVNAERKRHRFGRSPFASHRRWRVLVNPAIPAATRSVALRATLPRVARRLVASRGAARRRAILLATIGALAALAHPAVGSAQRVAPPVRSLLGDVAVILRPGVDGALAVGIAGPARALTLTVRASDARRWADSASRLVVALPRAPTARPRAATGGRKGTAARPAPNDSATRARVVLEEPGIGAGSLVLSRVDSAGTRTFLLFADDAELTPIRQVLTLADARTLVRLVQRAAAPLPAHRPRR